MVIELPENKAFLHSLWASRPHDPASALRTMLARRRERLSRRRDHEIEPSALDKTRRRRFRSPEWL